MHFGVSSMRWRRRSGAGWGDRCRVGNPHHPSTGFGVDACTESGIGRGSPPIDATAPKN